MNPEQAARHDGPTLADDAEAPRERMPWWGWAILFPVVAVSGYATGYGAFALAAWGLGLMRAVWGGVA